MAVALTNLVAYYKMEEASGNRSDSSGNGLTLTDNNTVTSAAGKVDTGAFFTAANLEHLSHADDANFSMGNIDFMLTAWVKLTSKTAIGGIMTKDDSISGREYWLQYSPAFDRLRFAVTHDGSTVKGINADALGSPSTGTWYFIVAWHDAAADTINIQINNGTVDSTSHSLGVFDGTHNFSIGSFDGTAATFFDGTIDEASVWKRILSSGERTELYNSGFGDQYPFTISTVTKTVKPGGGGDYSSLAAWATARKGNLRGRNTIEKALCFGGDLGSLTMDTTDWNVDSSRYVQIIADPSAKHAGKKSTASTVAHISSGATGPIENRLDYTRIADLSMDTSATIAVNLVGASNCLIERCIMDGAGVEVNNGAASNTIRNSVVQNADIAFHANGVGTSMTVQNCSILAGVSAGGAFKVSNNGTITEQNNYVKVTSGSVYNTVSGTINKGSNTATANTEATTQSLRSIAYSTDNFVNVNSGQEDFHLTPASALKDKGADLSASFTDDLDGVTRNQPFDIGADQNLDDAVVNVGPADFDLIARYRYQPRSRVNIWRS